jgi:Tol biopolymer transport system component
MALGKIFRRPTVLLALCLCSVGAVVTVLGRLAAGPAVAMKRVELHNEPGAKAYPAFSPDGQRLAYSARAGESKDETFHIFVRDFAGGAPQPLTSGPASDLSPAWSPDGTRIAFLRVRGGQAECVVIPADGSGEERAFPGCTTPGEEAQPSPAVAWMGDGQSLVVVQAASLALLTLRDGAFHTLTQPPAGAGDSTPAVSPDSGAIAFVRANSEGGADIFLCEPSGANARRLTFDDRAVRSVAWTRDGQDVLYVGALAGNSRVWRVPAYGGSPRDLILAGRRAQYAAVAPAGNRMVYTESPTVSSIWRATLGSAEDPEEHALIRSSGRENVPQYSPDGKTIADVSDQTGSDEIWLSDANGGGRVQVTNLKGPAVTRLRWSPDGKWLLFDASSEQGPDLYVVSAAAGAKPERLQVGAQSGSWSRDGQSIYFQSKNRIWKAAANGANPRQLSPMNGASQPVESADGQYVYFRNRRTFWRMPVEGGDEEQAIVPEYNLLWDTTLQPSKKGMYYIEFERGAGESVVSFYDFAEKKSSVVFRLKNGGWQNATYSVSPDGKYLLYSKMDQSQTNIQVLENFR